MDETRLKELLDGFPKVRIAVIGDFFLDKWLTIDRGLDEPSLETGLTAYQVVARRLAPGAAGTVTNNLAALDVGEIHAVGFAGLDGEGYELVEGLRATGVSTDRLVRTADVFTPTYIKPLFDADPNPVETNRLDIANRRATPTWLEERVIALLREVCGQVDAVIALDQVTVDGTGVLTARVREALADIGRSRPGLVLYADSRAHAADFRNVIVKCNHKEALDVADPERKDDPDLADESEVRACALAMAQRTGRPAFVTWGGNGIFAVDGIEATRVPAVKVEGPIDVCGAGDSANAAIVAALCRGATSAEAALVANLTASITIQQIGTTGTASRQGILKRFRESRADREGA